MRTVRGMRVVAAIDKFRGTVTARDAAAAVGHAGWELDIDVDEAPMSDGGEGLVEVLGGANRTSVVTGPLGEPVEAPWRLSRGVAVIEMAAASGLALAGGAAGNDPLAATTAGVGELIDKALDSDVKRLIVGLGGSATTDGGLGALEAIHQPVRLRSIEFRVACDVRTRFSEAAKVFGPQKGASPLQVELLTRRLQSLAKRYRDEFDVDVDELPSAGAAGGLAGGLAAVGGRLESGFELVADEIDLYGRLETADAVITGEGYLDAESLDGKVVGGACELAAGRGCHAIVVAGNTDHEVAAALRRRDVTVISLVERFGEDRALRQTKTCIETASREALGALRRRG